METYEIKQKEAAERENLESNYSRQISDLYFSQGISNLNKIVGLKAHSQFSLGLFQKLGINFKLIHLEKKEMFKVPKDMDYSNSNQIVELLLGNLKAYVISATLLKEPVVNIRFTYHDEEDLKMIMQALDDEKGHTGSVFLTFVYLHEVQHILRKHNTTTFNEIMLKTAQLVDTKYRYYKEIHEIVNFAEDYCINYALWEIFMHEKSEFKSDFNAVTKQVLFNKDYKDDNEGDVLTKLLNQQPKVTKISETEETVTFEVQERDEDGNDKGEPKRITITKENATQSGDQTFEEENEINKGISSIANAIRTQIESEKKKGDGNFLLNEDVGNSIKTNVDWFDKIKSSFYSIVSKKTRQTTVNWSKFNHKYRRSHKSPTHINIENKLHIIMSVDNSGSMMTESLRKLLYIIEKKSGKIENMTILKHTNTITGILENEKNEKVILDFLGKRDTGGTSHKEIFEYLDNNLDKAEAQRSIFISFSDNHSDIETEYHNYKNIQRMPKFWLNSDGRPVESFIPGDKVDIF